MLFLIVVQILVANALPVTDPTVPDKLDHFEGDDDTGRVLLRGWLVVDETVRRKSQITPKSVFITPIIPCAKGYRLDEFGRCQKTVTLNAAAHLEFLLKKLNSMYGPQQQTGSEASIDEGPVLVPIPLATQSSLEVLESENSSEEEYRPDSEDDDDDEPEAFQVMVVAGEVRDADSDSDESKETVSSINNRNPAQAAIVTVWKVNSSVVSGNDYDNNASIANGNQIPPVEPTVISTVGLPTIELSLLDNGDFSPTTTYSETINSQIAHEATTSISRDTTVDMFNNLPSNGQESSATISLSTDNGPFLIVLNQSHLNLPEETNVSATSVSDISTATPDFNDGISSTDGNLFTTTTSSSQDNIQTVVVPTDTGTYSSSEVNTSEYYRTESPVEVQETMPTISPTVVPSENPYQITFPNQIDAPNFDNVIFPTDYTTLHQQPSFSSPLSFDTSPSGQMDILNSFSNSNGDNIVFPTDSMFLSSETNTESSFKFDDGIVSTIFSSLPVTTTSGAIDTPMNTVLDQNRWKPSSPVPSHHDNTYISSSNTYRQPIRFPTNSYTSPYHRQTQQWTNFYSLWPQLQTAFHHNSNPTSSYLWQGLQYSTMPWSPNRGSSGHWNQFPFRSSVYNQQNQGNSFYQRPVRRYQYQPLSSQDLANLSHMFRRMWNLNQG